MFSTKVSSISMATLTTIELPVAMIISWILWGPLPNFMKILGLIITLVSIIWLVYEEYSINKRMDDIAKDQSNSNFDRNFKNILMCKELIHLLKICII